MLRRSQLLVDAAIALAVFGGSIALLAVGEGGGHDESADVDALSIALTALASLPLIARRVAPLRVFVVTGLASSLLRLVAVPAGPPLGPTVALFTVGASPTRQRRALAIAVAMLAVHVTASGLGRDAFPGAELALGTAVWGGVWLAGERTRLRAERMAELEERAERAEREAERERRLAAAEQRMRIARDLHDSAGHAINVILVHAGLGRLQVERDPAAARAAFETIEEVARETVGEIDQMVRVLREDVGDAVEPPTGVAALDGLVARHRAAGLDVITTYRGARRVLPASVDTAAYRIVQEALTNAARHGDGAVQLDVGFGTDALDLRVANPVRANGTANGAGHGLIGMRERAALLGGSVEAGVRDGRFEVRARLPIA